MTGSDCPKGGWTPETLYEHFTRLRESDQDALQRALDASDKRLMGMNEFRASVQDILSKTVTRAELWSLLGGIIGTAGTVATVWAVFGK